MGVEGSSRNEIMDATFAALCERGYAGLTMQSIADEFDKSKSLIHYHYDSKQDLLAAFMEHLLDGFIEQVTACDGDTPADRLRTMATMVITGLEGDDDADDLHTALLELQAQAPYDRELREQLVRNDVRIRELIAAIVRDGQDSGQFDDSVDPEAFATLFRSVIDGAQSHEIILGDEAPTDEALAAVETLLVDRLLVDRGEASAEGGA